MTIELAKEKFIQRLNEIDTLGDCPKIIIPNTFDKFALYYYENFRKRKDGSIEYKRIPITPMLRPYLENVEQLSFCRIDTLRDKFNAVFPEEAHKFYDMRVTFNSRCKECGVADHARIEFMGHSPGELGNTYTDLSDEYLIEEGEKFKY